MSQPTTEARVRRVIAKTFALAPTTATGDLRMKNPPAWDSLGHMTLLAALEKEFGFQFAAYTIPELVSLDAIVQEVEKQQPQPA